MNELRDALRATEIFSGLSEGVLDLLAEAAVRRDVPAETMLWTQGAPRRALFVILDGSVEISRERDGIVEPLSVEGRGEAVGVGAFLHTSEHTTSARALTELSVIELPRAEVRARLMGDAAAAMDVVSRVAVVMNRHLQYQSSRDVGPEKGYGSGATRREHDLLGERDVPVDALYGVQTLRAVENFPITGIPVSHFPALVRALAMVKLAAARANARLGLLPEGTAAAIERAAQEVIDGHHHGHFVVDMVQGGAGTSTNMNANEVIANRALEILGRERGDYAHCHPNNHVNLAQSTNDVYPTALRIARDARDARPRRRPRAAPGRPRREGGGVPRRPEDGADAAAGRRPDDAGPGVRGLRGDDGRGRRAPRGDGEALPRGEHGGDGDRDRDQRRPALPRARRRGAAARHRPRHRPLGEPRRGDARHGRVRACSPGSSSASP